MRLFRTLLMTGLIAAAPVAAKATDLLTLPTSADDSLPVADAGFDWNGFYAGVYGVTQASPVGGTQFGLGVDLGVDARFEFVLVGAEVSYQGLTGGNGSTSYIQAIGKAGLAATDDIILYGAAGLGTDLGVPNETDALIGAGVSLAVADNVSLEARYLHAIPLAGANPKEQFTLGANFHF